MKASIVPTRSLFDLGFTRASLNAGFKTMKWVPVADLTFDEKVAWDEEQSRNKGKVLTAPKEKKEEGDASTTEITNPNTDGSKDNAQEKETILKIDPGGLVKHESGEEIKDSSHTGAISIDDERSADTKSETNIKDDAAVPVQKNAHTQPHTEMLNENVKM